MANKEKGEEEMFSMLAVDSRECESKRLRGVLCKKRLKEFPFHVFPNFCAVFKCLSPDSVLPPRSGGVSGMVVSSSFILCLSCHFFLSNITRQALKGWVQIRDNMQPFKQTERLGGSFLIYSNA